MQPLKPRTRRSVSGVLSVLSVLAFLPAHLGLAVTQAAEPDTQTLFDGRTLTGWRPADPTYWTVEDGAITGRITPEHPCTVNQYLVWEGGDLADFELTLKSRVRGEGGINNGFQFRSRLLPDHDVCGYQVDNNLQTPWLVRLYDEYGRHTLAMRGERATYDAAGQRTVTPLAEAAGPAWFRLEDWHAYRLTCRGSRIELRVDGRLAAEVEDQDPRRAEPQGVLALQLHSGPTSVAQFKDLELRILKPAAPTPPAAVPAAHALTTEARAWWPLDTGGHGARPALRHIPAFEQFELNVGADGAGARPRARVVVLDGAYFESGPDLAVTGDQLTVWIRMRDPRGAWNATLTSQAAGPGGFQFRLAGIAEGLPEPQIRFEVLTDQGPAAVSVPVSRIEPRAWHDLAGRYDGRSVALCCDGRALARQPATGRLMPGVGPLHIGAERDGDRVVRQFRGDLEGVALWARALSDSELLTLSGR